MMGRQGTRDPCVEQRVINNEKADSQDSQKAVKGRRGFGLGSGMAGLTS